MTEPGGSNGRTRALRSETRSKVIDAAAKVFADKGIAASSVREIAHSAGLTKGALYSNFASKDDLILALLEDRVLSRLHKATEAFEAAGTIDNALRDLGGSLVDAIRSDAAAHRLLFEYASAARRDPELQEALTRRRREGRAAVAAAIERIAEVHGLELQLPADELAVAILAISNGLALEAGIDPTAVPDDLFGRLIGLIITPPR